MTWSTVPKAISYALGFVSPKRPFSTEAQIELSYTVEKGLFRLNFFRLSFRLADPVEKLIPKRFTRVFLTERIVHPTTKHTPTPPYGHTPIPGATQQYRTRRRRWRGYHCCCLSQQVSVAHSYYSSGRQQRVSCIARRQQRAVSIPCCQQRLRLL